ncbi:MAG TPA: Crp/Fnr family transcriptional regulator [Candidatus Elarobacter sp.]|nr:Crp/Fnr family transcriptional regulator [Candidatus Elarobacter sp.]
MARPSRQNRLLGSLDGIERARLAPFIERVDLDSHQVLSSPQQPIEGVFFPVEAVASTLLELVDGQTVEVGLMGAEGMTGLSLLFGVRRSNTTVVAQMPGTADRMPARAFTCEVVERGGPFYRLLLRYANGFMEMTAQIGACNASHSIEQRCARWILLAQDHVGGDTFPLTHEYLALMLGVRRAGVSGAASALRAIGAIDYGRGHIEVIDRARLLQATCPCYAAMVTTMNAVFAAPN